MVPASLCALTLPAPLPLDFPSPLPSDAEFHLHPHYLAERPLDTVLLKTDASLDDFISEKYHDKIAAILAEWSSSLLRSPQELRAIERVLAADFIGSSVLPVDARLVRSGPIIEVHENQFGPSINLGRDAFLRDFRSAMGIFSKIVTAEFQVTHIAATPAFNSQPPQQVRTRVRFELAGTGNGFYREQRVGYWDLEWEPRASSSKPDEFQLRQWQVLNETRSRSSSPVFADITAAAIGGNSSYSEQLLRGVDHWRTVLDGASGIDLYGHNGVSVADIDNDGCDDLYICQPAGLPNRLYRNRGDGTFEDITESSGLGILDNTACALFADFDNDGRQDVVVVRASGPLLFLNQGGGKFRQKPGAFQFASASQGTFTGASVADYDRDGWLDIYFCLYSYYQGTDQYKYPVPYHDAENGPPNFMMRNARDGTFHDVTAESGLNQNNTRYSFCCGWSDYNRDGWPDLYVVNDFGRKNLYRNNGNGTFTDVAPQAGVEDVGAGMSVCWSDFDNDGKEDLYVADMWTAAGQRVSSQETFKKDASEEVRALYRKHAMGNSLFRNSGSSFEDRTAAAGVGMGRWSWSSDSFDFDHDGFPDLYVVNGMVSGVSRQDLNSFFWRQVVANSPNSAKPAHDYEQGWSAINELIRSDGTWSGYERNVFYANNRDGTFSNVSAAVSLDFVEDGRSFALADFDQDGRQEVFLKNRNAPQLRLLKNVIDKLPPSIALRLRGTKSNRDAIGAAITVETEFGRQTRMLQAGSGFLSQHSKEVFFGLGETKGLVRASIRWPSGLVQEFGDLPIDHRIWVEEESDNVRAEPFKPQTPSRAVLSVSEAQKIEPLPTASETWLLVPVTAPDISLPDFTGRIQTLSAFRGKPVLLNLWTAQSLDCQKDLKTLQQEFNRWKVHGLQLLTVNIDDSPGASQLKELTQNLRLSFPVFRGSDAVSAVYNILYRYLFDRHRDLSLPTSFLIDQRGDIVKIYQGPVNAKHVENDSRHIPQTTSERLAIALPFSGVSETYEFGRNYLSFGSIFFQRGYIDQAAASFQLALREDPSSAEACYGLGSAYLSQQKTSEARESFERATKLRASYPDTLANAWNNLGLIATRESQTDEAVRCFKQALRLSPDHLIALNNLGNAYRLQKNWDEARKTFERALAVNAGDPEANYGLAMVFAQADDAQHANEYLQRALKARPAYPEALNNLGILYLRTQRRDDAVASFEECIRIAPAFDQSYLNLARVYALENAPNKARAILLALLKQHPDHLQAQGMLDQLPH
ncbi:MAG TPA: FG-GAP-like repeat-containing protein [Candidatus Sulfotelmatobacter sp.]|jgi:tetratricopeptide (TPR) repeat protein/thiol-disulfide isomerase/thioredoxin|nr:FG-GAP-like repeat-containing protein [Candidatus Sulfotelmatobacter sp.]